jgi:hypothetical protein
MLFISCVAPLYIPNGINVPLMKEKGDANFRFGNSLSGHDFQSSYAISDEIGLMLNVNYCPLGYADSHRKHKFVEIGIGRFKKYKKYGIVELYSGLGIGTATAAENEPLFSGTEITITNGRYIRLFTQCGIGGRSELLDLGLYCREIYHNFYYIDNPHTDYARQNFRLEPVFFLGFGPPVFRLETQYGFSFNILSSGIDTGPLMLNFYEQFFYSSISIRFNL